MAQHDYLVGVILSDPLQLDQAKAALETCYGLSPLIDQEQTVITAKIDEEDPATAFLEVRFKWKQETGIDNDHVIDALVGQLMTESIVPLLEGMGIKVFDSYEEAYY